MSSNSALLRNKVIEKYFSHLNDKQFEAATSVMGAYLLLAGAGSGKTTVLINRIVNMLKFGNEYYNPYCRDFTDDEVSQINDYLEGRGDLPSFLLCDKIRPWEIMAITFTNKAAKELKNRIDRAVNDENSDIWASTFHSTCARIMRIHGEKLGYDANFSIYDADDQKKLITDIMKTLSIDEKFLTWRSVVNEISNAKNSLVTAQEYALTVGADIRAKYFAQIYTVYERRLKEYNAMDFDDLIFNVVRLFREFPDVLDYYQNRFKYIMVDEYQDTNYAQFVFVKLLAEKYNNICVVGDDDQSIYKFRGATIENILNFEKQFKDAKLIKLEQNYRSTQIILDAANDIIKNNLGRKGKNLWTNKSGGDKISLTVLGNEREEAKFVCETILSNIEKGIPASNHAVLYRMNVQSNALESALVQSGINYKIYGGTRFYDRKEIKDVLAYLNLINNQKNSLSLLRIINEPKRGIGAQTVANLRTVAEQENLCMLETALKSAQYELLSKSSGKLTQFAQMMYDLIEKSKTLSASALFSEVIENTGYEAYLRSQGDEGEERLENVKELLSSILQFEQENEGATISEFLEMVELLTDMDLDNSTDDRVSLMTMHSAKGLEFPVVFIVGFEEGLFPSNKSIFEGPEELEEERRLAYVAVTRAKNKLHITNAASRMLMGKTERTRPSRFVKEIPVELIDKKVNLPNEYGYGFARSEAPSYSQKSTFTYKPQQRQTPSNAPKVGSIVKHKAFGRGMVLSALAMGNDFLLEIAFDSVGTKKIMNNFAKLEIIE